jgi:Holliday junction resolvasome RuvABC endonuclease subunit
VPSPPDVTDALALAIAFCWRKQAAKALGRAMPGYAAR